MNREVKFRAKDSETNEWVFGGGTITLRDGRVGMFHIMNGLPTLTIIVPETVGQMTGLKDSNGVNIYENDIVGYENMALGEITWEFNSFNFHDPNSADITNYEPEHDFEILGNSFDDPELLT